MVRAIFLREVRISLSLDSMGWFERDTFESGCFRGISQARGARTGVVYAKKGNHRLTSLAASASSKE